MGIQKDLFIHVYKNNELYLQRKVHLGQKAFFIGSKTEADICLPVQEVAPFQFLVVPPLPQHPHWRIMDEVSEACISLDESSTQAHDIFPWHFEFKLEETYKAEWQGIKHNPTGDILVLTSIFKGEIQKRQYKTLTSELRINWQGQELNVKRKDLRNSPNALVFNHNEHGLELCLSHKHELHFISPLVNSLRGLAVMVVLAATLGLINIAVSPSQKDLITAAAVDKVMVVKIPAASHPKVAEAPAASSQSKSTSNNSTSKSMVNFGKAFNRFNKGLRGMNLAPSRLAAGFMVGNLSGKLQATGGGSGTGGDKLFTGASVGNSLGKGMAGVSGIRLLEDEVESTGGLKKEIIAQYIKSYLGQIVQCFERELSIQPDLTGKVVVNFTINGSGHVGSALIQKSQFNNNRFHGCITGKVAHWTFPVPDGGINVVVNYPFLFRAQ